MVLTIGMFAIALASLAYDNGAPHSRLPPLGWSSWVALGPNGHHPIFDFCDEATVMRSIDALHAVGMFEAVALTPAQPGCRH